MWFDILVFYLPSKKEIVKYALSIEAKRREGKNETHRTTLVTWGKTIIMVRKIWLVRMKYNMRRWNKLSRTGIMLGHYRTCKI